MTATPPLSAETSDSAPSNIFTFSSSDLPTSQGRDRLGSSPLDGPTLRRRAVPYLSAGLGSHLPYSHPRSLHSILRNSPLPPRTAIPPPSPRRQSLRLQEKAAKKVGYNSPLTQDIVTNRYTKSHIELLGDDASPGSPYSPAEPNKDTNIPLAFTVNEIQDGGQTPSPFGGVRRTLAAAGTEALSSAGPNGIRKRKRTDKRRQWVWTIGQDDEDDAADDATTARPAEVDGASLGCAQAYAVDIPGFRYLETPTPSVESASSAAESVDVSMSDACSVDSSEDDLSEVDAPNEPELDLETPVAPSQSGNRTGRQRDRQRDTPIPELCGKRDTPVPPELM
ncbi:protein related to glucan 1, 4-alpha-glucosidase [Hirsutella rhossiliensis]|uniref:Proteinrelated to glucan 1, 4-alpha-glucosidase n=1 Tax=Hirsutella rhossiliensis TaxID=111463 RepID=A0A9P8SNC2_9HYPO|nr:proteinrelated to glucan 1, 4-alpha-glucosidase [Hirsutella rhossiliensis]KAH0967026.1 proteinrelated to glucan 1, 4-alpha-glucosidase [Hirsutella rhossiliensis]